MASGGAKPEPVPTPPLTDPSKFTNANVILVTFDGVRPQEFFHGVDPELDSKHSGLLFPYLTANLIPQGVTLGNEEAGQPPMQCGDNSRISLPNYEALMAGYVQPCGGNNCDQVGVETLPERISREMSLPPKSVAVIASWDMLARAAEHKSGSVFVNAGNIPMNDGTDDPEFAQLNAEQAKKENQAPWRGEGRFDRFTAAHALHYLKKYQPRLLYVSFLDSDNWAHLPRRDYPKVEQSLLMYDQWLQELMKALSEMGDYGRNTTIIITTDHGRGRGKGLFGGWSEHGRNVNYSRLTWLYGRGPATLNTITRHPIEQRQYSTLDIRPTVETLFGLAPQVCKDCGSPIESLIP